MKPRAFCSPQLPARLMMIATAVFLSGLVAIPLGVYFQVVIWATSIMAMVVCVISSLVAHIVGEYPRGDDNFMTRLGLSIAARTIIPLMFVLYVKSTPRFPFEAGFVLFVILFYLVGLFTDILMNARRLSSAE